MEEFSLAIAASSCKCMICEFPLSVFPVFLYEGGSICGRCSLGDALQSISIRNTPYETIAQFAKFPCKYQNFGCPEKIIPSKMVKHENTCKYKQYLCPMTSCSWRGELENIYDHYNDAHTHFILTDPRHFELDLINIYEESYLIQDENDSFVLRISFDNKENEFFYSLYCIDRYKTGNDYFYRLEFVKQFGSKIYSLPELPANDCEYSSFDKAVAPKVLVKDILSELQDPLSVVCSVNVARNATKARRVSLQRERPENCLLDILECPVCQEYMVPPIFQCLAGHAICSKCKELVQDCPECRGEIGNTRNFRLEQMTQHIEYPCKYSGCPFIGKADQIKDHEAACILSIYECPLKKLKSCKWSGFYPAILDHVNDQHPEDTIEVPVVTFICEGLDDLFYTERNILPACGQLFLVYFQYSDFQFFWSVQLIGPKEEAKNYFYELDFKDNSGCDKRLFVKRPCSPLTEYEEIVVGDEGVLTLDSHLLNPLIDKGDLIYSCNILPVF